jgi:hypothetical protein
LYECIQLATETVTIDAVHTTVGRLLDEHIGNVFAVGHDECLEDIAEIASITLAQFNCDASVEQHKCWLVSTRHIQTNRSRQLVYIRLVRVRCAKALIAP